MPGLTFILVPILLEAGDRGLLLVEPMLLIAALGAAAIGWSGPTPISPPTANIPAVRAGYTSPSGICSQSVRNQD